MNTYSALPRSLPIMGIDVTPFRSYDHAVKCIAHRINTKQKTFCVAINPEKVYRAVREAKVNALLREADIQICDGIGIVYATRLLLRRRLVRCTGIRLFFELVKEASKAGWKTFLLGGTQESNSLACHKLKQQYENLKIVGQHHGYFKDDDSVIGKINSAQPHVLFVAMGSPKQEYWISRNRDRINATFFMGIGGALDTISGRTQWAPKLFRATGTEFLYRLIREPHRWRRQTVLPKFAIMALKARFAARRTQLQLTASDIDNSE